MYSHGQNVGGLKDVFKKVKKVVRKIDKAMVPRELSPMRFIEHKQAQQAKKVEARSAAAAASVAAQDATSAAQIDRLRAQLPMLQFAPAPGQMSASTPTEQTDSPLLILAVIGAIGAGVYFLARKRR